MLLFVFFYFQLLEYSVFLQDEEGEEGRGVRETPVNFWSVKQRGVLLLLFSDMKLGWIESTLGLSWRMSGDMRVPVATWQVL